MSQSSQLMQEWFRVGHRFRHLRWSKLFYGMSRSDFFVMTMIFHHRKRHPEIPGIYASTIAEHAQISRAAVSRQLQQLEDRGWITRCTDPNSKRSVFVDLTDAGLAAIQAQHDYGAQFFHHVFTRVGEQRMTEAMQSLNELLNAMEIEFENLPNFSHETRAKGECE